MFDIVEYLRGFYLIDNKDLIKKWEAVFNQMAVHTRKRKPEELLLAIRPNEEKHIHEYRLKNYRAITYGSMNRALDSVTRILNKIQYSVKTEENVKEYLNKKNFEYQGASYDFYSFFEKIILKRDIEDPNGFIAWFPTGEGLVDSSQRVAPKPKLFLSSQVYDITADVIVFIAENVSQKNIKEDVTIGNIYYAFTKNEIYKLTETTSGENTKNIQYEEIYKHDIGEIPVLVLGGDMNAEGYYESFFAPYNAFGDEAISTFSDWQAIKVTSGFPYTEEFYEECEIKRPNLTSDDPLEDEQKYSRKVSFDKFPRTPFNTIIRKIPGNKNDAEISGERILPVDVPSKRFISPDIATLQYSGEAWQKLIDKAEAALHLNLGNQSNQTAEAKTMDKEEHYAMIDKISNNYFNHLMYNSIKYIDSYINVKSFEDSVVSIVTPQAYRVKTESSIIEEIVQLKQNKVPDVFLAEATNELANKRFSGNPLSKKIFEVVSALDPLYIKDINEKQQLLLSGVVTKEMFIRSTMIYQLLYKIANNISQERFIKEPIDKISDLLEEELLNFLPEEELPSFSADGNIE